MADRSVLTTSTFNDFRREVNGTARDIGDISDLLGASNLTTFTAFQLKVVMTGTSSCYPPRVKDLRGIALAV